MWMIHWWFVVCQSHEWIISHYHMSQYLGHTLTLEKHRKTMFSLCQGRQLSCQMSRGNEGWQLQLHILRPGLWWAQFLCSVHTKLYFLDWFHSGSWGTTKLHRCQHKDSFRRVCLSCSRTLSNHNWIYCNWFCSPVLCRNSSFGPNPQHFHDWKERCI